MTREQWNLEFRDTKESLDPDSKWYLRGYGLAAFRLLLLKPLTPSSLGNEMHEMGQQDALGDQGR